MNRTLLRPVATSDELHTADQQAAERFCLPTRVLMETAGRAAAEILLAQHGALIRRGEPVAVLCGRGLNGGDGLVVARWLRLAGARLIVYLVGGPAAKGAAHDALTTLRAMADDGLRLIDAGRPELADAPCPALAVDALLGTGASGGTLREPIRTAVERLVEWADAGVPVIALDLPTGVGADDGAATEPHVRACDTITFAALKPGLLMGAGREAAGTVHLAEIGFPTALRRDWQAGQTTAEAVRDALPQRAFDSYKYSTGKVFVLAGSVGKTGAAVMTATAALRIGAGAVVIGAPRSTVPILAASLTEAMFDGLPETDEGELAESAFDQIAERLDWADVLLIGPGLGRGDQVQRLIRRVIRARRGPVVIDADALFGLTTSDLTEPNCAVVTPHEGELKRLASTLGIGSGEGDEPTRWALGRQVASKLRCTVLVKGAPTITVAMDGFSLFNPTGTAALATVGTGDVLTGFVAGLLAQGATPEGAAAAGAYLHGRAAQIVETERGARSLIATDLLAAVGRALVEIEHP